MSLSTGFRNKRGKLAVAYPKNDVVGLCLAFEGRCGAIFSGGAPSGAPMVTGEARPLGMDRFELENEAVGFTSQPVQRYTVRRSASGKSS